MKIEIKIITNENGTVRCSLQPPMKLDSFKKPTEDEEKTCKVLWMKIDELLLELSKLNDGINN